MEIHPSHIKRYELAKQYTFGKTVLDAGCADGFGTAMLAENAAKVVGVDNDPTLVAVAKKRCASVGNIEFVTGDVRKLPFADNTFDVAVSFEIIEHFIQQEIFLGELNRVVKDGGIVIISTPNHTANEKIGVYQPHHEGHGHPRELTFDQFFYLMSQHFDHPEFFGQFFYNEPSLRDMVKNKIKRLDVLKLRKLIPGNVRDKHNPSIHVYGQEDTIKKLTAPAVQMLAIGINKK